MTNALREGTDLVAGLYAPSLRIEAAVDAKTKDNQI